MAKEYQSRNKMYFVSLTSLTIYVAFLCQFEIDRVSAIECGTNNVARPTVKGGSETLRGEWPFVVALYEIKQSKYFCGGTLISIKHVLTAAHCIQAKYSSIKLSPDDLEVRIGAYNLTSNSDGDVIARNVTEIYVHPDWEVYDFRYDADLAILVLNDNVSFTNYIQPVCMPADDEIIDGTTIDIKGHIVGWGLAENKTHEEIPRQAVTQAFNDSYCYRRDDGMVMVSSARTFCGGDGEGVPNDGDSGGGFFVLPGLSWVQYGIISAIRTDSAGHVTAQSFAVYTNVKMFKSWIVNSVRQSGGAVGVAIRVHKIDFNCNYDYNNQEYRCWLQDLDIRSENIVVASIDGHHQTNRTVQDVEVITFNNGTMFSLPDGFSNIFKNIKRVVIGSFLRLRHIKRSKLKSFDRLVELSIYDNEIDLLDEDLLWDLPFLDHFRLSRNNIKVISDKTFERNLQLKIVVLFSNRLEALPPKLFQNNILLEHVRFDGNALKTVDERFFASHPQLVVVDYSENQIEFLPKNLFQNNFLLEQIYFIGNLLTTIDEEMFNNNTNLRDVRLGSNQLEVLPRNLYKNNLLLIIATMRNISLKTIDEEMFVNNPILGAVDAASNQIEFLPKKLFETNLELEVVIFRNNSLKTIDDQMFANNAKLREVNFESNKLEFLHRNLFLNNLLLQMVDFRSNDLKIIEIDFSGLSKLRSVSFYHNLCIDAFYQGNEDETDIRFNEVRNLTEFQGWISGNCSDRYEIST